MKKITFQEYFIDEILALNKTVTRRRNFTGKPGDLYYFTKGRTGPKYGEIIIVSVQKQKLHDIRNYGTDEYWKEGLSHFTEFKEIWDSLNPPGFKWEDNPDIYRVEFKLNI